MFQIAPYTKRRFKDKANIIFMSKSLCRILVPMFANICFILFINKSRLTDILRRVHKNLIMTKPKTRCMKTVKLLKRFNKTTSVSFMKDCITIAIPSVLML